jgi:hypothetical protein
MAKKNKKSEKTKFKVKQPKWVKCDSDDVGYWEAEIWLNDEASLWLTIDDFDIYVYPEKGVLESASFIHGLKIKPDKKPTKSQFKKMLDLMTTNLDAAEIEYTLRQLKRIQTEVADIQVILSLVAAKGNYEVE